MSVVTEVKAQLDELTELWQKHGIDTRALAQALAERVGNLEYRLDAELAEADVARQKVGLDDRPAAVQQDGPFLSLTEKVAPHFNALVQHDPARGLVDGAYDAREVRLGALVAAIAGGEQVRRQLTAPEMQALSGMTGPAGGYVVPERIAALFLDEVRPRTRVFEAGAQTLPMRARAVTIPGWDTPITAKWRAEGAAVFVDTPFFRGVNLQAKTVATSVSLTWELLQDAESDLGSIAVVVEDAMGRALAQALDLAALHGSGTDAEPLGIFNAADANMDVNVVSLGTNGAIPADYDFLLDAIFEVENDNFDPTAALYSARSAKTLRKLKTGLTGDKRQLTPPDRVRELRRLVTNQIPNTLTQGTSVDVASAAFVADWTRLVIGLRPDIGMNVLQDSYSEAKSGQVVIYTWMRADVGLLNPEAFCVVKGILA